MKTIMMLLLALLCTTACMDTGTDDSESIAGDRAPSAEVSEELDAETAALVAAAETGDPWVMALAGATTNAACHAPTTCSGSCGLPSAPIRCGATFCGAECGPPCPRVDPNCRRSRALRSNIEVFQSCQDLNGNVCIQWSRAGSTAIGCGGGLCSGTVDPF